MDKYELRKNLKDKTKEELIQFIEKISSKYSLKLKFDALKDNFNTLVSLAWQAVLSIQIRESQQDFEQVIQLLTEDNQTSEMKRKSSKIDIESEESSEIKTIPFNAEKICKIFHKLLIEEKEFMTQFQTNRIIYGFFSLLGRNNINIPKELKEMLYLKIFKQDNNMSFTISKLINYGRYQLDLWEEDLKFIFEHLNPEDIDLIFSLQLIYDWIIKILEKKNIVIYYSTDSIPLFKRVILAQYLKLLNLDNYSDEELDKLASIIVDIISDKIKGSSIEILPWGDLE